MFFKIIIMKITGMVKIKVEGFFIERFLNLCKNENIIFKSLEKKDSSFITFEIMKSDFRKLKVIARKTGCKVKIENKTGLPFFVNKYKKRKVFAVAVSVIAFFIIGLSNFVWEVEIEGLQKIGKADFKNYIEEKGIKVGCFKPQINIEQIENEIKIQREDIAWVSIEFLGTKAKISIKESIDIPKIINKDEIVDIVANSNAVIEKIVVRNGTARVKEGDVVKKGDLLVEGIMEGKYKDDRMVHADADIIGKVLCTSERFDTYIQKNKVKTGRIEKKNSINIKNFKINFNKRVSKFEKYDTIRTNNKIRLFSNFLFPIEIEKIKFEEYYFEDKNYSKEELENKIVKELEEELEIRYKISQYADKHKRRDVVVNETSERFISHINIRNPN